jgi:hypothetical protein
MSNIHPYNSADYTPYQSTGIGHTIRANGSMQNTINQYQSMSQQPSSTGYHALAIVNAVNALRASSSPLNSFVKHGSSTRRCIQCAGFEIEYDVNGEYYGGMQSDVVIIDIRPFAQDRDDVKRAALWQVTSDSDEGWMVAQKPTESITALPAHSNSVESPIHIGINGYCDGIEHASTILPKHISRGKKVEEEKLKANGYGLFYVPVDHSAVKAGWNFLSKMGNSKLDKSGKESSGILAALMKEAHDRNLYVDWTSHRGGSQILTEAMKSLLNQYPGISFNGKQKIFLSDFTSSYVKADRARRAIGMDVTTEANWHNSASGVAQIAGGKHFGLEDIRYANDERKRAPADENIGRLALIGQDVAKSGYGVYGAGLAVGSFISTYGISAAAAYAIIGGLTTKGLLGAGKTGLASVPSLNEGFHSKGGSTLELSRKVSKAFS